MPPEGPGTGSGITGEINPGMRIDNRDIEQFYSRMRWRVTVQ